MSSYVDEHRWWCEGYEARVQNKPRTSCPYSLETESAECWIQGYEDADKL
ncbi:hypothetical protein PS2_033 [Serratia phage PS2]|uniref:Uncharacterized protein n=1 Tax=Serratia phage PS2 TaxID=1481112 RepID=A0A023W5G8_9CAUD|nr:hypothetical protein FF83_gp033 [Serratia phage PS2]AHY25283.1 hypothetical protein PS2_033 [Serratia phage PS2]